MKTHNTDAVHQIDVTRGRKNTNRAGSQGISVLDGNGADIHPVTDILFSNATATDGDDGLAIIEIVGGSSSSNESWAQADGGLTGDGTTDDTTALQTLIDSCTVNGTQSCTIRFEPGTYLIAGALQDTGAFNGQILLPDNTGANEPLITLTFVGPARPQWGSGTYTPGDAGYAVLKSTRTGGTGTAAVFSGGNGITNKIQVVGRDLWCIAPANPSLTFWNVSSTQDGVWDGVLIGTEALWPGPYDGTEPTGSHAYGIRLPRIGRATHTELRDLFVSGYYNGVQVGECAHGNIEVWLCKVGVELGQANHFNTLKLQMLSVATPIKTTATTYTDIEIDVEHANVAGGFSTSPAWAARAYDLDDSGNYLHGHIRWRSIVMGGAEDHSFTANGGANASRQEWGRIAKAIGPLLLASDKSSPIVFDDILQASDGNDFLYASEP